MIKYVLVSQGIKIHETYNKEEAYAIANKANSDWSKYVQDCIDNNEDYADNEVFVYLENE